ncbi:MAG: YggS family pyridoxal phosphate-dependent enzyme [Candidatus Promineifilaceae bacterium]|nr:YggS family pyridoxal phosphate-dependent enzyme [Candidatus Promineifilaceae bacterium]
MIATREEIADRYESVRAQIAESAARADRDPDEITLVAVTKTFPADVIVAAYELGMRHFGENRAYELEEKRAVVEERLGKDSGIVWHLVGPLQSRKTTVAADTADFFHALDRQKIARRLSNRLQETGKTLPVLLEVNVSGEESKHGFQASAWEEDEVQQQRLCEIAESVSGRPGLELKGLMTMAPWQVEDAVIERVFRRTQALAQWLRKEAPQAEWSVLSMGMTDDFELAIQNGATHLRIGRAIFGSRPQ